MVTLITGRSGAGKTEYLMERLPQLAQAHRMVYYIVPEQSSMALERRLGSMGLEQVKVVSFRRLCNEIFRAFGGVAGTYMSPTREIALIFRVLQQNRANLCYYKNARAGMGFVSKLAAVFNEFSLAGLEKQAVLEGLQQSNRADWQQKYQDLFLLYDAYRAALSESTRSAAEDLAAANALAKEYRFFDGCAVIFDGFFGFTGGQRELLETVFAQSPAVYCTFLLDPQDPALLFEPAKKELALLQKIAKQAGAEQKVQHLAGSSKRLKYPDLQMLEQHLFAPQSDASIEAEHIHLMAGRNIREELAMVAADIARRVREEGYRYKEIALVAGSLAEYGAVAENVFQKYGIPLFVDRGRASLGKPIFAFVQSALRIISPERYFRQEDVLTFLKTGLTGEDRDLISRLENFCILWQINGERFYREADWTQNPLGMEKPTEDSAALLQELNGLRKRICAPLLKLKAAAAKGSGAALAEGIYQLLCDFKVEEQMLKIAESYRGEEGANAWETQQNRRLSKEYLKLHSAMMDILDDIYAVFEDQPLSVYAMEELIGLCGEQTALNIAPPTQDAVTLGEIAHSRLEGVRALYVVGANQGILPMPAADRGLIGDREREFFARMDLPCNATLQQHQLQGQHRLYSALFSAREELTFSYSAFKVSGEALIPSLYIDKIRALTDLRPKLRAEMDLYDFALSKEGARELIGWEPALRAPILDALGEEPPAPRDTEQKIPQAIANQIFGDRLRLSYSQISLYQNCPFQYFMEKTMRIKPTEPITFDAANIGTFVHYGMEKLVERLQEENYNYDQYTPAEIQRFGNKMAEEYLEEQLKDFNRSNRFDSLYKRMTALFCRVAENVIGELSEGKFRPYGVEVSLSGNPIPLKDGGTVELIGSVDRVDTFEQDGKTYLKVTDYKTGPKTFDMKGITNRDNVQLPIYLYGLMKSGRWAQPIPAAGCYMEAQNPSFDQPVPPDQLEAKLRDFYRRNGAFSADKEALGALDQAAGSNYFKIRYTKSGDFYSGTKVYEPALMQELVDHMETVLKETAEGIRAGNAAAIPLKGHTPDGCTYCKFAALCGFDAEKSPRRDYSDQPFGWRREEEQQ
ncbi:MAG: PD-(D/E)XK nuclease family protein [Clostridia bacterium]|nr:PD-(D/E)XK nuclease family protein [Clostridia bacterium]